jgi:tetratricopeptide (TPR) repeat protein
MQEFFFIKARGIDSDLRESERVFDKAIDVFIQQFGAENVLTLQAKLFRAAVLMQKKQVAEAQNELRELIATCDRVLGPKHPLVLEARVIYAQSLFFEGKFKEAQAETEPLIAQLAGALSPHHPEVIETKFSLATTLLESGDHQRAFSMLRELVKESEEYLGNPHPVSVASRCALISCLAKMDRLGEAADAWNELIELPFARRVPITYTCGVGLAQGLSEREDAATAQTILLKLVPLAEAQLGADHVTVVTAKMGLAMNASKLGQLDESAGWWQQVMETNERVCGREHLNTTRAAFSLFLTRWRIGQFDECYRIFSERFLWFCTKDVQALDDTQRQILSCIQNNTPWLRPKVFGKPN